MKVLYDISVLGLGYFGTRSGLFRVAENVTYGLLESKKCDLAFCATASLKAWVKSRQYLEEIDSQLTKVPFLDNIQANPNKAELYYLQDQLINRLQNIGFTRTKNLQKILLKLIRFNFQPLNLEDLKDQNIFHSIYHPLPEITKSLKNIKRFLTVHDLIPILYPQFYGLSDPGDFNLKLSLQSINPGDWIICVSQATKNDLCNYLENINEDQVFIIPWAASNLFYSCQDAAQIATVRKKYQIPDRPYFLSLSTLEPKKNIAHTIRCFTKLIQQEKIKDVCLVLAGKKGWGCDSIFQEIESDNFLKERIITTGYVDDEDLAALYSNALAFIYPSLYEGFGLPPLEAMQCGTPVITSNTSSLPEVVGEAGIMLDPQDSEGMCQSMLNIYHSSSLRDELSLKSIERAKQFSWSKCIQQTIAAYKMALSEKK